MQVRAATRSTFAATSGARPTLREGSRGASVSTLQNLLAKAGFSPGPIDGVFGPKTEAAVKSYQRAHGLVMDGIVGPKTWGKLTAPAAPASSGGRGPLLRQGHRGAPVTALQQRLNQLGYNSGSADGVFGPRTDAAVKAFQRAKGLVVDGIVGPKTWDKLGIQVTGTPTGTPTSGAGGVGGSSRLAASARSVALGMGGYRSQGLCARGVSTAIQRTYGIKVWGNGNDIDNNLPRSKFKQVNMSLAQALKTPGLILTWERTSTPQGQKYGHTAITAGDGHTSYSDFIETNTLASSGGRSGFKVFAPI